VGDHLKKGICGLSMNKAVADFTLAQRKAGKMTVLVTGNIDLFTEITVLDLDLYQMFDAIVNSADYRDGRKEMLWPIAFGLLDTPITFDQCLLIEDSPKNVELFRNLGGKAYQYTDDASFSKWLANVGIAGE
jgi:beta-phosphoglucomutase-like phosphatase (HAD superfamily)